jgi:hypothetical protein
LIRCGAIAIVWGCISSNADDMVSVYTMFSNGHFLEQTQVDSENYEPRDYDVAPPLAAVELLVHLVKCCAVCNDRDIKLLRRKAGEQCSTTTTTSATVYSGICCCVACAFVMYLATTAATALVMAAASSIGFVAALAQLFSAIQPTSL